MLVFSVRKLYILNLPVLNSFYNF